MRREFTKVTKEAAWVRCQGLCEACGQPILPQRPEYHHIIEAALDADAGLDNILVVHKKCHAILTKEQSMPRVAKVNRIRNKARGIVGRKHRWPKGRRFGT